MRVSTYDAKANECEACHGDAEGGVHVPEQIQNSERAGEEVIQILDCGKDWEACALFGHALDHLGKVGEGAKEIDEHAKHVMFAKSIVKHFIPRLPTKNCGQPLL